MCHGIQIVTMDKKQEIAQHIKDIANRNLEFRTVEAPIDRIKGEIIRLIALREKWQSFLDDAKKNNAIDIEIEFLENNLKQTKDEINDKKNELLGLQENI